MSESEDTAAIYDINSKSSFIKKQRARISQQRNIFLVLMVVILSAIYIGPTFWRAYYPKTATQALDLVASEDIKYPNLKTQESGKDLKSQLTKPVELELLEDSKSMLLENPAKPSSRQYNQDKSVYLSGPKCENQGSRSQNTEIGKCELFNTISGEKIATISECRASDVVCSSSSIFGKTSQAKQYILSFQDHSCFNNLELQVLDLERQKMAEILKYSYSQCNVAGTPEAELEQQANKDYLDAFEKYTISNS